MKGDRYHGGKKSTFIRRGNPEDRRIKWQLGKPGCPEESELLIFFGKRPMTSEQPTPPQSNPTEQSPQEEFLRKLKQEMKFPVNIQGKAALDDRNKDYLFPWPSPDDKK